MRCNCPVVPLTVLLWDWVSCGVTVCSAVQLTIAPPSNFMRILWGLAVYCKVHHQVTSMSGTLNVLLYDWLPCGATDSCGATVMEWTDCHVVLLTVLLWDCLSRCGTVCPAVGLSVLLCDSLSCGVTVCPDVWLTVMWCDCLSCCVTDCPVVWITVWPSVLWCEWLPCTAIDCPVVWPNVLWCDWPTAMWCDCLSCIVTDCNTLLLTVMPCDCLLSSKARSGINVYGVHSKIYCHFFWACFVKAQAWSQWCPFTVKYTYTVLYFSNHKPYLQPVMV